MLACLVSNNSLVNAVQIEVISKIKFRLHLLHIEGCMIQEIRKNTFLTFMLEFMCL